MDTFLYLLIMSCSADQCYSFFQSGHCLLLCRTSPEMTCTCRQEYSAETYQRPYKPTLSASVLLIDLGGS